MVQLIMVCELAESKGMKHLDLLCHFHNVTEYAIDNPTNDLIILILIQKWLRETHNLNIGLTYFNNTTGTWWDWRIHYKECYGSSKTYELALLEGINQALNLL